MTVWLSSLNCLVTFLGSSADHESGSNAVWIYAVFSAAAVIVAIIGVIAYVIR